MVIHPASTTHGQLNAEELEEQGIRPNTIRLSIGTEHIDDIISGSGGGIPGSGGISARRLYKQLYNMGAVK